MSSETVPDDRPADPASSGESTVADAPDAGRGGAPSEARTLVSATDSGADTVASDESAGHEPEEQSTIRTVARKGRSSLIDPSHDSPYFDDYEILGILGKGAFAKVYLARQIGLDRLVALKVSADLGQEARTMARLEHDHIVPVFSETVDRERGVRLICMRYVPGTTLEKVVQELGQRDRSSWSGRVLMEAIDALSSRPGEFDPTAYRDREALGRADWVQAVCWVGARLAEALAHAHSMGVLHRDIKSANILINTYGRPLVTDFNLASSPHRPDGPDSGPFGGTLATMAPEHIDALNPHDPTSSSAVDQRSDLYSLGVVIYTLLTGRRPFGAEPAKVSRPETFRAMADDRRAGATSIRRVMPEVPEVVNRVILRCLEPDPARRYQSATELARALDGCRELRGIERALPPADPLTRAAIRRPFAALLVLTLTPHLIGSLVNIAYNAVQIIGDLTPRQQAIFPALVLGYNAVVYPICLVLTYRLLAPAFRDWRAFRDALPIDAEQAAVLRRRILSWPLQAVLIACIGWLPGGLVFPMVLSLLSDRSEPIQGWVYGHFLISFWFSGLIALTYTFIGAQFIAIRVFYPQLWVDPQAVRSTARQELARVEGRLRFFQFMAGLIPLASAALLVGLGPENLSRSFRGLATGLIVLGMAGIGLTHTIARVLSQSVATLTGSGHRPQDD